MFTDKIEGLEHQKDEELQTIAGATNDEPFEPIETLTDSQNASLKNISKATMNLSKIKESLGKVVDGLADNPSIISQLTRYWGRMPLYQQIAAGTLLTIPTLTAAIITHMGVLFTISAATATTYAVGGIALSDHHRHTANYTDRLKEGVFGIADVLIETIQALDEIRRELSVEVEKFRQENIRLTENIENFSEEIDRLSNQVKVFAQTEELLENEVKELQSSVINNSALFEKTQAELKLTRTSLDTKVQELDKVKTEMGVQLEQARTFGRTYEAAAKLFSNTVIANEDQRKVFTQKLDTLLEDNSKRLEDVVGRFDETGQKLAETEQELAKTKQELQELKDDMSTVLAKAEEQNAVRSQQLIEQAKQILQLTQQAQRQERLLQRLEVPGAIHPAVYGNARGNHSMFGNKKAKAETYTALAPTVECQS